MIHKHREKGRGFLIFRSKLRPFRASNIASIHILRLQVYNPLHMTAKDATHMMRIVSLFLMSAVPSVQCQPTSLPRKLIISCSIS